MIGQGDIVYSEPLPVPIPGGGGSGSLPAKPQEAITENITKESKEPSEIVNVEPLIQGYAYKESPEVVNVEIVEPEIVKYEEKPQVVEPQKEAVYAVRHEEKTSVLDWLVLSGGIIVFLGVFGWIIYSTRLHVQR